MAKHEPDPKKAAAHADDKRRQLAEKQTQITKLQAEQDALEAEVRDLTKQEYPKMLYHPDFPARIVNSREEEDKLNDDQPGWVETLADLPKDAATLQTNTSVSAKTGAPSDAAPYGARVASPAAEKSPPNPKDKRGDK